MNKNIPPEIVKKKREFPIKRSEISSTSHFSKKNNHQVISSKRQELHKRGQKPRLLVWGSALAATVILFFVLSLIFSGASIDIKPRQQQLTLNGDFIAERNTLEAGKVPYAVMTIEATEDKSIKATDTIESHKKASGSIIIYNNYNSRSQRLIRNTRFETPDGKIYRINKSVTVPGRTSTGGDMTPGSIKALVYADIEGTEYNIGLTDFTIPGFKGDPRYKGFYARSKTKMAGGFSGVINTVSEKKIKEVDKELNLLLKERLSKEIKAQKPEGFHLFNNAQFFEMEKIKQTNQGAKEGMVNISKKGKISGLIFNENKLAKEITKSLVARFDDKDNVKLLNIKDLTFSILNKDSFSPQKDNSFSFSLKGSPYIVWDVDTNKLILELAGKNKRDFKNILSNYPNIESAEVTIRPFWKRTLPKQTKDFQVKEIIDFKEAN